MVNYPNKKKTPISMTLKEKPRHYTSHRGMSLEEDIGLSNEYYLINDIAVVYKKPTPVQIVKVDYPKRSSAKIVEAYYRTPSTTDYNGIYKGKYIDFEAKETKVDRFPFSNIYKHQIDHLNKIINHGGIAFLIIAFTHRNEVYLIDASYIIDAYYHSSRKSMKYEEIKEKGHLIKQEFSPRLNYLDVINQYYF